MYNTKDFEQAMHVCSYKLDRVFYHKKHSRFVQKIYGRVPIPKKVTISGERKIIIYGDDFVGMMPDNVFLSILLFAKGSMIFPFAALRSRRG